MAVISTKQFNRKATPQTSPAPGAQQVQNNAGGFVFEISQWDYMRRFLILGSEGGTYYVNEQDLTKQNHANVLKCIADDGTRAVNMIVEVSDKALAPKTDPAIFALALCAAHGSPETKAYALANLNKVCRIGTHLFHFAQYVNAFRGWGRGLRRAIGTWYLAKSADALAYQAVKYQQRDGWSHADLLRLSHPLNEESLQHQAVLRWMVSGADGLKARQIKRGKGDAAKTSEQPDVTSDLPEIISAFERAKTADEKTLVELILTHDLPREAIPTEKLNSVPVWEALLEKMPITAMIRNLGKMTNIGLLKPLSAASKMVSARLKDTERLAKGRVHPMAILIASKIYGQGHGDKGSMTWVAVPSITQALDEAFYLCYANVKPTGKPLLFGLDVSGSMGSPMAGTCLSCAEGTAALALIHANVEPDYHIMGFSNHFVDLGIRKGMSLGEARQRTTMNNFGSTDCSLPAQWALKEKAHIGGIVIMTDNETYAGCIHPFQALKKYRDAMNPELRQVVVGMTATGFSIADPKDKLSMDVVGFDASAPAIISDFIRGEI